MRASNQELPTIFQEGPLSLRETEWGGLNVAMESFPAGIDSAPLFKGLPDDRCQCPHWGYVIKGRIRVHSADHEEVLSTGDVYYLAPGHTTVVEEATELVEFSPRDEYQKTQEVAFRNWERMQQE